MAACFLLSGCTTTSVFRPQEYPVKEGAIATLDCARQVSIVNDQPSIEIFRIDQTGGLDYIGIADVRTSNLRTITAAMVSQVTKELPRICRPLDDLPAKEIRLKVLSLKRLPAWNVVWQSRLEYQAILGNGETFQVVVPCHSLDYDHVLSGCIAKSIVTLFEHRATRAYLGS